MKLKLWTAYVNIEGHDGNEVMLIAAEDYESANDVLNDTLLDDWDATPDMIIECDIYLGLSINASDRYFSIQDMDTDTGAFSIRNPCECDDDESTLWTAYKDEDCNE